MGYSEFFSADKVCEGDELFTIEGGGEKGGYFFAPHKVEKVEVRDNDPEVWNSLWLENGQRFDHTFEGEFSPPFFPYFFKKREGKEQFTMLDGHRVELRQATPNDIKIGAVVFLTSEGEYIKEEVEEYEDGLVYPYLAWKGCNVRACRTGWESLLVATSPVPPPHYALEELKKFKEAARKFLEKGMGEYEAWVAQFGEAVPKKKFTVPKKEKEKGEEKKLFNIGKAFTKVERTGMEVIMPIHYFIEGEQFKLPQFSPPLAEEIKKIRIGGQDSTAILMRFEGGNVITAYLRQAGEGWEVFRADAKYYPDSAAREAKKKVSLTFGANDFPQIKEAPFDVNGKVATLAKTKRHFSFVERQGMAVAYAHKYLAEQSGQEICHALRAITGEERIHGYDYAMEISYLFGDGIEIIVYLYNLDRLTESWRTPHLEDWVVFRVKANTTQGESILLENKDLLNIKEDPKYHWHHPNVMNVNEIESGVGIFVDNAAGEGYTEVDPERNQNGHFTMYNEVKYAVLVPGDLARAKKEAQKILDGYLAVNAVAVFYNGPSGEAFYEDNPTGNYKGSKHHPFNFVCEYPYDPSIPWDHERALAEAKEHVASLGGE